MSRIERHKKYRENSKKGRDSSSASSSFFRKPIDNRENTSQTFYSNEEEEYIQNYINSPYEREDRVPSPSLKKKKRKRHPIRNIILLILGIAASIAGVFAWRIHDALGTKSSVPAEFFDGKVSSNGAHNILILGTDQREQQGTGAARADSIMVLQMDGPDKKVKMVSFMRDLLVDIPNVGTAGYTDCKINAAYGIGEIGSKDGHNQHQGANLVRETLKTNFGIDCKYYAVVNFSSFVKTIDTLFPEGVPIEAKFGTIQGQHVEKVPVPDDLATSQNKVASDVELSAEQASEYGYEDPAIYQMINEGKQNMTGRMLLNYARFRHDDDNDAGRVKRQQQVMEAFTSNAKSWQTVLKTPEAIRSVLQSTSTNMERDFLYRALLTVLTGNREGKTVEKLAVPDIKNTQTYVQALDMYGGSGIDIEWDFYRKKVTHFLG